MQNAIRAALVALALVFAAPLAAPVAAQDFDAGRAAYQREDYGAALQEWQPLAERGHARAQANLGPLAESGHAEAQYNLGLMYALGKGVAKDFTQAHMWWTLAARQHHQGTAKNRDIAAASMTPEQIA